MGIYVLAYDIGTTGVKTCLYSISKESGISYVGGLTADYDLYVLDNGGVEQDPEQWWSGMCVSTVKLLTDKNIASEEIKGISFCAQMQAVVLTDADGRPVRRAMSYMDNRGGAQMDKVLGSGIKISGMNAAKALRSIKISGAVSASAKDPVWKYRWVADNEPEVFGRVYKWLDVKDWIVCRATGRFVMSRDSAFATLMYDTRSGRFSEQLCRIFGVDMKHLPDICECTDEAGPLTEAAAAELGLRAGIPVFSGGGDASLIGVGAGAVGEGDTHIYVGTSGWISTVVKKQELDIGSMIASIVGADPAAFNCFAELETAGKCLEWARDEIGLDDESGRLREKEYSVIMAGISDVPAGSNGVIFTPWLHGNRCPFEDPDARGIFFGIGLGTCAEDMIHSVIEGVAFHLRWQKESMEKKVSISDTVRFAGGGALAPLTCQIMADVLGRRIETVEDPQDAGAAGAAALMAAGLGLIKDIREAGTLIHAVQTYEPIRENTAVYDELFPVFKDLYKNNRAAFRAMSGKSR